VVPMRYAPAHVSPVHLRALQGHLSVLNALVFVLQADHRNPDRCDLSLFPAGFLVIRAGSPRSLPNDVDLLWIAMVNAFCLALHCKVPIRGMERGGGRLLFNARACLAKS